VQLHIPPEPITADDVTIRRALEDVDVAPMLAAIAYLTGDLGLLRPDLRPNPDLVMDPNAGLSPEQMGEARDMAAQALSRFRDGGSRPAAPATTADLRRMIAFLTGGHLADDYYPLLLEELAIDGVDPRAPTWRKDDVNPNADFTVGVVGAGMSGLAVSHRLKQAGVPFVVFEKNADVGGTWFENIYPGCRVDVPNHLYSYSFAQTGAWPEFFSSQEELLAYFRTCADELGLRDHIRFGTEVVSADFRDETQNWCVQLRTAAGGSETIDVQALVSAVGQLNRPKLPDIAGRDRFAGPSFHSARWDYAVELHDQRVAVIGTGASAAQFIPIVAEQAAEVDVFQRTAPWLAPTPNYHDELPEGLRWLLRHVPAYARWDRLWLFWRTHEGLLPAALVDPDWDGGERSVSSLNEQVRELLTEYLKAEFDSPELFAAVVPDYPPIAKRILRDNGVWARTLSRDNVELITERIAEITERGVITVDGVEHPADVVIYGTGFEASRFLTPMTITGCGGIDLHQRWDGNARAYLGLTIPDFPNLFLMYGPNTNIVINGSIIYFSECEAHYIVESIRMLLEGNHRSMDCRKDVHDAYNIRIDNGNRAMAWGVSKVSSWYKSASGRVAQNWPFSLLEYWQQTRTPDPDDYVLR
jgi:4-hydroxyacetophenone monooxygenase